MSIALMTLAWKSGLPSGQKVVLLALCDNANDQGECYPSVPMLAIKCSLSERSVQQHIADLVSVGIVSREMRTGRSTLYRLHSDCFNTPATAAPRKICTPQLLHPTPADSAPPPPQLLHPTPATAAPITINESSIESSGNHQRARRKPASLDVVDAVALPAWLPLDAWNGYLDMRASKRKAPTAHAINLLLADFAKWHAKGHDIGAALNASTRNGWTDVYEPKGTPAGANGAASNVSHLGKAGQATARNAEAWLAQKMKEQENA